MALPEPTNWICDPHKEGYPFHFCSVPHLWSTPRSQLLVRSHEKVRLLSIHSLTHEVDYWPVTRFELSHLHSKVPKRLTLRVFFVNWDVLWALDLRAMLSERWNLCRWWKRTKKETKRGLVRHALWCFGPHFARGQFPSRYFVTFCGVLTLIVAKCNKFHLRQMGCYLSPKYLSHCMY